MILKGMEPRPGLEPGTCRLRICMFYHVLRNKPFIYNTPSDAESKAESKKRGAEGRDRTGDLAITNRSLYQLSYFGLYFRDPFFNLLQRSTSIGVWNHRVEFKRGPHVAMSQNRLRDFRIYSTRM
jgi:hypothetical protein